MVKRPMTIVAAAAEIHRDDCDAFADAGPVDARADLHDPAGDLVAKHDGWLREGGARHVFVKVSSTQPGRCHFDDDLTRQRCRIRDRLHPNVVVTPENDRIHPAQPVLS